MSERNEPAEDQQTEHLTPAEISAGHAIREMHYGRIAWLAEHIRQSNFRIEPIVARKLLALIERTEPNLFFELKLVRRSDLPPAHKDPQLVEHRNFAMAVEVARRGGFKRGHGKSVCHEVGKPHGLEGRYVYRCVKPYREIALEVVENEEIQAAYERGEVDFLGRPISSQTPFAEGSDPP